MDCSPPDSSVHEILQARKLEWATIPFSRGSGRDVTKGCLSRVCSSSCPLSWCRYLTMSSPAALFSFCLQSFPAFNSAFNISQGNVCVFVCVYVYIFVVSCSSMSDSFATPARLLCPWDFPGKDTGVGCLSFSRGSSWPRNRTRVFFTSSRFFTIEPLGKPNVYLHIYTHMYIYV